VKQIVIDGYHVEVGPAEPYFASTLERRLVLLNQCCEEIAAAIRRHVDDVGSVRVVRDSRDVCSFCGCDWTELSEEYNGGCCDEDCAAEDQRDEVAQ